MHYTNSTSTNRNILERRSKGCRQSWSVFPSEFSAFRLEIVIFIKGTIALRCKLIKFALYFSSILEKSATYFTLYRLLKIVLKCLKTIWIDQEWYIFYWFVLDIPSSVTLESLTIIGKHFFEYLISTFGNALDANH